MKSIKYLLTAILMVSTGLSAMEPAQNNALVSAKVQAVRDAGSMEAYELGKIQVQTVASYQPEVVQLPQHIVKHIADYAGVEEAAKEERIQKRLELEKINQRIKEDTGPIRASLGAASGFMALQSLFDIYDIIQHDFHLDSNTLKFFMLRTIFSGAAVGSFSLLLGYGREDKLLRRDEEYWHNKHVENKAFKWEFVRKYPGLYLKNAFDTTTKGFKVAFGAPFAITGLLFTLYKLDQLIPLRAVDSHQHAFRMSEEGIRCIKSIS